MWPRQTWKWIKVLHCISLSTTFRFVFFSFFQCHVEMCLVKLSNTANQEFSLSPAVSLDPKLPFSTPYSRTLCVSAAAASQHSRISHYVCPQPCAPHIWPRGAPCGSVMCTIRHSSLHFTIKQFLKKIKCTHWEHTVLHSGTVCAHISHSHHLEWSLTETKMVKK